MARDETRKRADGILVAALAAGSTLDQAAAAGGVGRSTVARRLRQPGFQRAIGRQRAEILRRAAGTAADASVRAVAVLAELLEDDNSQIRLAAGRALLTAAARMNEAVDLAARVAELEQKIP